MAAETKTVRSRRTRAALIAAVHQRLRSTGAFTATEIAADVGCTPGTFWAHFDNKDDAITAAFREAVVELEKVTDVVFGDGPTGLAGTPADGRLAWAVTAVDELIAYFATHELLYRLALSRVPEHRPLRQVFREAEARSIDVASAAVGGDTAHGAAIITVCQGVNNSILLRTQPGDPRRRFVSVALAALSAASA